MTIDKLKEIELLKAEKVHAFKGLTPDPNGKPAFVCICGKVIKNIDDFKAHIEK